MSSPIQLMLRYFDGDLTKQEAVELDRLIAQSPAAAKTLARLAIDQAHFGPAAGRVLAKIQAAAADEHEDASAAEDLKFALQHTAARTEADELLQYLLRLEDAATPITVMANEPKAKSASAKVDADTLSAKQIIDLVPYMLLTLARTRAAKWVGGYAAAAAVVLLAGVIWYSAGEDEVPSPNEMVGQDHEPPHNYAITPVATLTDEHDAQWDRRPGEDLFAGQRFELTQGFAEVTTARGAVVVVQAPAQFELIHSLNALYLHSGKLVGRCDTAASKGFVVKTHQADIVDLGTEFGVGVAQTGEVSVRVFEGLIEVSAEADPDDRQAMVAGDLARIDSGQLKRVAFDVGLDFQRQLQSLRPVPQVIGQARWLSSPPPSVFEHELVDADNAYLFLEKANARVPAGTVLCETQGTSGIQISKRHVVENEMQADVYMLHYDAAKFVNPAVGKTLAGEGTVKGQIVFDRPIVGVIGYYLKLRATQPIFADPGIKYGYRPMRGLDDGEIQIGPDGRTLIFNLSSDPHDLDQMRILVAAHDDGLNRPEGD